MQETQTTQSARVMFTNWPLLRDYFGTLGQVLVAVAVVERFGKRVNVWTVHQDKKIIVAIVERSP